MFTKQLNRLGLNNEKSYVFGKFGILFEVKRSLCSLEW